MDRKLRYARCVVEDPNLGRLIAQRYRLIARLGADDMATVYLARHVLIERLSALKLLAPELADEPLHRERFLREARAVNRINHPNIVEITDYGEERGVVYSVMEYVPGETLERILARGPIGWLRAAHVGLQIAAALGRAHEMGVLHRGLAPANVLLETRRDGRDRVKLTDFGVDTRTDAPALSTTPRAAPGREPPEYEAFGHVDARSDLYALGVLLYEATSGTLPYLTPAPPDAPPPPPLSARAPLVPAFFEEVVMTLLAADPQLRPRDGFETFDLLRRALETDGRYVEPVDGNARESPNPARGLRDEGTVEPVRITGALAGRPNFATCRPEDLALACARALIELETAAAKPSPRPLEASHALASARRLTDTIAEIAGLVREDGRRIQSFEEDGREMRAELGRRLDALALTRSRALGWAGTLAEHGEQVRAQRDSGIHPVPAMDAMEWEHAAVREEEELARLRAWEAAEQMSVLRAELEAENERLEAEMRAATAVCEGHVAALRTMAAEAWDALERGRCRLP